jgi:hypothetical protein
MDILRVIISIIQHDIDSIGAGIQALVNQKTGDRQGNPNPVYYRLAAREYGNAGNDAQDCAGPVDCYQPGGKYGVMSNSDAFKGPAGLTIEAAQFVMERTSRGGGMVTICSGESAHAAIASSQYAAS